MITKKDKLCGFSWAVATHTAQSPKVAFQKPESRAAIAGSIIQTYSRKPNRIALSKKAMRTLKEKSK